MTRHKLWPWIALALIGACFAVASAAERTTLKDNARDYLAQRQNLKAITLTPQQMTGPTAPWRGKTVELFGTILGRTNATVSSGASIVTVGLRLPGESELVMVDSAQEHPLLSPDQVVHILADLPESAKPADNFMLRAVIAEEDLPAAEWRNSAAVAALERAASTNPRSSVPLTAAPSSEKDIKPEEAPETATTPPPPSPEPAQPVVRPGTKMPQLKPSANKAVAAWKKWVAGVNPRLTDVQLEVTVRSVIYYSALLGIDHRLAFAMIRCESGFNPTATSHAGAIGMTQLMPGTASGMGVDPWDIEQNIKGGLTYLSRQLHNFPGKSNYEQCMLGLACYNAGPGAVQRAGGVPNIPETFGYVKRVVDLFYQLYKAGMP
ncbi:MAG: lytic transglycosylase domain-containing protein [Bacteroidota bacterium]